MRRTLLRSLTTAAAPLLFGFASDQLGSGAQSTGSGQSANTKGLAPAFLIMLIPLVAGGLILLRSRRDYPRDVASEQRLTNRKERDQGDNTTLR